MDHNKFSSLYSTAVVSFSDIFVNANVVGILPKKSSRATLKQRVKLPSKVMPLTNFYYINREFNQKTIPEALAKCLLRVNSVTSVSAKHNI